MHFPWESRNNKEECYIALKFGLQKGQELIKIYSEVFDMKINSINQNFPASLGTSLMDPNGLSLYRLNVQGSIAFWSFILKLSKRPRPDLVLTIWIVNHASFVSSCFTSGSVIKNESHFGNHRKTPFSWKPSIKLFLASSSGLIHSDVQ